LALLWRKLARTKQVRIGIAIKPYSVSQARIEEIKNELTQGARYVDKGRKMEKIFTGGSRI